jgi:predicted anti-sigma-YlaC factor YlaD
MPPRVKSMSVARPQVMKADAQETVSGLIGCFAAFALVGCQIQWHLAEQATAWLSSLPIILQCVLWPPAALAGLAMAFGVMWAVLVFPAGLLVGLMMLAGQWGERGKEKDAADGS